VNYFWWFAVATSAAQERKASIWVSVSENHPQP